MVAVPARVSIVPSPHTTFRLDIVPPDSDAVIVSVIV